MKYLKTYHPPGAAQRSTTHFAYVKKSYFLFSYINLKAARDRKPCSFAKK